MKGACLLCDKYKLETFKKELDKEGFSYMVEDSDVEDLAIIMVLYEPEQFFVLQNTIEIANRIARNMRLH